MGLSIFHPRLEDNNNHIFSFLKQLYSIRKPIGNKKFRMFFFSLLPYCTILQGGRLYQKAALYLEVITLDYRSSLHQQGYIRYLKFLEKNYNVLKRFSSFLIMLL